MSAVTLTPYRQARAGRRFRPVVMALLLIYSLLTGVGIVILPPEALFLLALPVAVGAGAVLWMLPDQNTPPPVKSMSWMLVTFVGLNCLWPAYIALNLPGLPWISPTRILIFIMVVLGLYSYSTSKSLRAEIADDLNALPFLRTAFWLFWGSTVVANAMSGFNTAAMTRWLNNQIYWTFFFVVAVWLGTKPGVIDRVAKVLVWTAIVVSLDGIWEFHQNEVPWAQHIPSWLIGDPVLAATILRGHARAGTDVYRSVGTFNVSLVFAEYLAIVYPFVIHAAVEAKQFWRKSLLIMSMLALLVAMWATNARSGMIGFFLSVFLYGGMAALRHWRRHRESIAGVAALSAMPMAVLIFIALALTWPRLHNMTIGGGQHQSSTDARDAQWAMGRPKIITHPLGHGASRSGSALGYTNLAGVMTIDSYYLSLLLDYGFLGFFAFLAMFAGQFISGLRLFMTSKVGEESLSGPIVVALINFLVIKAVLSSEFNVSLAFIFLGFLFALEKRRQTAAQSLPGAVPGRTAASLRIPQAQPDRGLIAPA
jgi:uncharacterized membrane protein YiaA